MPPNIPVSKEAQEARRRKIPIWIACVLAGAVYTLWDATRNGGKVSHSIVAGIFISLALVFLERFHTIEAKLEDLEKRVGEASEKTNHLTNGLSTLQRDSSDFWTQHQLDRKWKSFILCHLEKKPPVLGKLANTLNQRILQAVEVYADKLVFTKKGLIYASYQHMWAGLVEEQQSRLDAQKRGETLPNLELKVLHSTQLSVMKDVGLLHIQKRFCDAGGTVTRILVGRLEKPDRETDELMREMHNAGVNIGYYSFNTTPSRFEYSWDFLYLTEGPLLLVWHADRMGEEVRKAIFTMSDEYDGEKIKDVWRHFEDHADFPFKKIARGELPPLSPTDRYWGMDA
jgi:hypothetical protein